MGAGKSLCHAARLIDPNYAARPALPSMGKRFFARECTYIITPQRTYYLCAIMDLCGRYIIAYQLGTEINATLVSDTVRDALAREKGKVADGLLLHSDQGCQYTSEEYFALTQENHFSASMSRRGCPYDNAIMKNFGTFKTECLYRCRPTTGEQVHQLVD